MVKIGKSRLMVVLGSATYLAALIGLYVWVISPVYSYYAFTYTPPGLIYYALSCGLALVPSIWMPIGVTRPSHVAYWMLYLFVILPSCILPTFSLSDLEPVRLLALSAVVVSSFAVTGLVIRQPVRALAIRRLNSRLFLLIFLGVVSILVIQFLAVFGSRLRLVSLLEVYDLRAEFISVVSETGTLVGYSIGWMTYVIGPTLLAIGILKRWPLFAAAGVVVEILVYSAAGFRIAPMVVVLVVGLILLLRTFGPSRFGKVIVWTFAALVVACIAIGLLLETAYVPFLLVGRPIMMPGLLTGFYFDFFGDGPKALLGHSVLRPFFVYPYDRLPPFLIGQAYFNDPNTQANASVWADAYANFGFAGMYVFAVLLGGVLWLFDCVTNEENFYLACALMGIAGFVFANSALLTTLLTHGVWLMFVILLLVPGAVVFRNAFLQSRRLLRLVVR